ncbi:rhomboid-like protein [Mycobacterium sp.]|uniref:rhomboid-like protein n=1 Tax=Mycobacterium sp. TaxID=1785 RepID=UPI003428AA89
MTLSNTAVPYSANGRMEVGARMLPVTAVYAALLFVVSVTLTVLGPHTRDLVVSQMSTNLHNLAHGHWHTLVGSAFVNDGGEIYFWLPGLVCLLALGELIWRSKGLLVTFAVGHVGATLIVAEGLVAAVKTGWLPLSVARASDVGTSYGAVCVLGALTASIPLRWRHAWMGWWLGTAAIATVGSDFTAVGHVVALLLGLGLSFRLGSITRWTSTHVALLVVGATFGWFMLSGSSLLAVSGGLTGALLAFGASRYGTRIPANVEVPQLALAR